MQLDKTRIAIRERSFPDLLDLALRVIREHSLPLMATLAIGLHTLSAQYSGDTNFQNSSGTISVPVTKSATTTTVSSSLATSTYGQNVTFSAAVTPAFGALPSGQISFYDGTNLLGTVNATSGAAQITLQSLTGGTHSITAQWVATYNYAASTSNARWRFASQGRR